MRVVCFDAQHFTTWQTRMYAHSMQMQKLCKTRFCVCVCLRCSCFRNVDAMAQSNIMHTSIYLKQCNVKKVLPSWRKSTHLKRVCPSQEVHPSQECLYISRGPAHLEQVYPSQEILPISRKSAHRKKAHPSQESLPISGTPPISRGSTHLRKSIHLQKVRLSQESLPMGRSAIDDAFFSPSHLGPCPIAPRDEIIPT